MRMIKRTLAFVLVPFVIVGTVLLVIGLATNPSARTDDGDYSELLFLVFLWRFLDTARAA